MKPIKLTDAQQRLRDEYRKAHTEIPDRSPYHKSTIIGRILFTWIIPLISFGNKVPLEQEDNYPLRENKEGIEHNYRGFKKLLKENIAKGRKKNLTIRTLLWYYKGECFWALFLDFSNVALNYSGPFMVYFCTKEIEKGDVPMLKTLWICGAYTLCRFAIGVVNSQTNFWFSIIASKMKMCIVMEVYSKGLKICTSYSGFNMGKITNLISVDAAKLDSISGLLAWFFQTPFTIAIGLIATYLVMGVSAFSGFGLLLVIGLIGIWQGKVEYEQEDKLLKSKDERVKLSEQIFSNIKFVKLYVLENFVTKKICEKRDKDLKRLSMLYWVWNSQTFFGWMVSPLNTASVLLVYFWVEKTALKPANLFTFFSVSGLFIYNLFFFPNCITAILDVLVSLKRIDKFLLSEELSSEYIQTEDKPPKDEDPITEVSPRIPSDVPSSITSEQLERERKDMPSAHSSLYGGLSSPNDPRVKDCAIVIRNGDFFWEPKVDEEEEEKKKKKEKKESKEMSRKNSKRGSTATEWNVNQIGDQLDKTPNLSRAETLLDKSIDLRGSISSNSSMGLESSLNNILKNVNDLQLKNINLAIPKGKLVAIVGEVGAGKSSLFSCLFGEMKSPGIPEIRINGKMVYVNQKPWIQGSSIRENILFGKEFDAQKYRNALQFSCLEEDLKELPERDLSLLGDKGINLSGGQKARVSFARALYSEADIYLLYFLLVVLIVHVFLAGMTH